jgi:hypothetical protein
MDHRYHELAAGFYGDASPPRDRHGTDGRRVAPAVLVVGGLAVGVAWAIAAYPYAVNLREQTWLAERELDARVEASREGRPLQTSTLPPRRARRATPRAPACGSSVASWWWPARSRSPCSWRGDACPSPSPSPSALLRERRRGRAAPGALLRAGVRRRVRVCPAPCRGALGARAGAEEGGGCSAGRRPRRSRRATRRRCPRVLSPPPRRWRW